MNSEQAFPGIDIQCKDRVRNFCLNLGAFRALEEHMKAESNDPDFSILDDFDFALADTNAKTLILLVWAGLFTDARKHDKEVWTIENAEDVVDMLGAGKVKDCIEESLRRVMSPEQYKKMQEDGEKKIQERKARKQARAKGKV